MIFFHILFIQSFFFTFDTLFLLFPESLLYLIRFLFISISGFNLYILLRRSKLPLVRMHKRLRILISASVLISLATYILDPELFIFFGVIHLITFCNLIVYACKFKKVLLPVLLLSLLVFPQLVDVAFLSRDTFDYFPLYPFSLMFFLGFYLASFSNHFKLKEPNFISKLVSKSLVIYLLHPVVIFISLHLYYSWT